MCNIISAYRPERLPTDLFLTEEDLWGFFHSDLMFFCTTTYSNSFLSVFLLKVLPGWLPHWRLHQRLPGRLLSALHRPSVWRSSRALRPLHGELWRLQLLRPHRQGLQTLGVQPAFVAQRAAEVLREVPALHPLLFGLWISPRQRVLLYLWVWSYLFVLFAERIVPYTDWNAYRVSKMCLLKVGKEYEVRYFNLLA